MKMHILAGATIGLFIFAGMAHAENEATYNTSTGFLNIPIVTVGSDQYQVDLQHVSDLTFSVTNIVPLQSPLSTSIGQTRSNPAPIGTPVTYEGYDRYTYGDYKVRSTVLEIIRGDDAWNIIYETNKYNDEPISYQEYILVKVSVEFLSTSMGDIQYSISKYTTYEAVTSDGVDYPTPYIVLPEPELHTDMYVGGSYSGWIAYLVNINDKAPLLTMGREGNGSGGVWMKIYNE